MTFCREIIPIHLKKPSGHAKTFIILQTSNVIITEIKKNDEWDVLHVKLLNTKNVDEI